MGEINVKLLKEAIDEVNALEVEDVAKLRKVGIKKEKMAIEFSKAVKAIDKIDGDLLSEFVVDVYNDLPSIKDLEKALGSAPAKEDTKKDDDKAEPKPKKAAVGKSRYGHVKSAKSGLLDDALFEGGTVSEIMEAVGVPRTRFASHVKHLKEDKGLTIVVKKDKDGDKLNDHYKVKEPKCD